MARPRVINQDEILDAAEHVVQRDGAARLTLDAVAAQARVSKGSVIYDYKSKNALIKAIIERRVAQDEARLQGAIDRIGPVPNALIKARIAAAGSAPDQAEAVTIQLCSALAQDVELRASLQASISEQVDAIVATSDDPRSALVAFLAVEGLRALEYLGLLAWPMSERAEILQDIQRLIKTSSEVESGESRPVHLPESSRGRR